MVCVIVDHKQEQPYLQNSPTEKFGILPFTKITVLVWTSGIVRLIRGTAWKSSSPPHCDTHKKKIIVWTRSYHSKLVSLSLPSNILPSFFLAARRTLPGSWSERGPPFAQHLWGTTSFAFKFPRVVSLNKAHPVFSNWCASKRGRCFELYGYA